MYTKQKGAVLMLTVNYLWPTLAVAVGLLKWYTPRGTSDKAISFLLFIDNTSCCSVVSHSTKAVRISEWVKPQIFFLLR